MTTHTLPRISRTQTSVSLALLVAAFASPLATWAQDQKPTNKTVVAEPTSIPVVAATAAPGPFVVFTQWLQQVSIPVPTEQPAIPVLIQTLGSANQVAAGNFEAAPVILGQPELPLLGQAAVQAAQQWNSGLNYQGMTVSFVVLDSAGRKREVRPIDKGLAPGERFKIRYTTSFEAVSGIDMVVGDVWSGQNFGQVWPQPGTSVQSNAGETVELPLDAGAFFQFDGNPSVRYVLNVRHPNAKGNARSNQPAYRQDGARASQYLQLVPKDTYPAIAQVVTNRNAR